MITRLEQRTSKLEAILARMDTSNLTQSPREPATPSVDPVKEYYRAYNEGIGATLHMDHPSPDTRLGAYLHVSSMLSLNHSPTFADPAAEGIIERREMRRMVDE